MVHSSSVSASDLTRERFEELYEVYNRPEFIHPDPLEFVLQFDDPADREVAGLIASSLAYGRVSGIMGSLEKVFDVLRSPAEAAVTMPYPDMVKAFERFRHRWTTGAELAGLIRGIGILLVEHGSLERAFSRGLSEDHRDVIPALTDFTGQLRLAAGGRESSLLPCPSRNSACKRLFLYLRWMVRCDDVDPGPWKDVSPSLLIVPMDVHMHRISLNLGLTDRRQADLACGLEVTEFFRTLAPGDPVRYDFALTRFGIHPDIDATQIRQYFQSEDAAFC